MRTDAPSAPPAPSMPNDSEAERVTIGAMIVNNDYIAVVLGLLDAGDFYRQGNRLIFGAIRRLAAAGSPADFVTLRVELQRVGELEAAGGLSYLSAVTDTIPRIVNVEHYAAIVAERSLARELIRRASAIVTEAAAVGAPAAEVLERASQAIFELGQRGQARRGLEPIQDAIGDALEQLQNAQAGKRESGVMYGIRDLDEMTGGMGASDLTIVAARTSVGKSAFALHVARTAAESGKRVGIFSAEMARSQVAIRLFASVGNFDAWKMRHGFTSQGALETLDRAAVGLMALPIWVDDSADISLHDIRARARRAKAQHGLDLAIVDYLQLVQGPKAENRQQQVSEISRGLKAIARDIPVPVMALSQLSRQVESRAGGKPQLSDLRESGSLEQDSDTVLMLYRENDDPVNKQIEIMIGKQRNGPIGTVSAVFIRETQRFEDVARGGIEQWTR